MPALIGGSEKERLIGLDLLRALALQTIKAERARASVFTRSRQSVAAYQ